MLETFLKKLRIMRSAPVLLGRWCRTGKKLNDVKVDLANVDHCGICFHEKPKKSNNSHASSEKKSKTLLLK
jgi:hypothetical protein